MCVMGCSNVTQEDELNKITQLVVVSDSLARNQLTTTRIFIQEEGDNAPIEFIQNEYSDKSEEWESENKTQFTILFAPNQKPIIIVISHLSSSGDNSSSDTYFFDSLGRTRFYEYEEGHFSLYSDDIVVKNYIDIYFNDQFKILKKTERRMDERGYLTKDTTSVTEISSYEAKFEGLDNFEKIINNYKIKLQ